jgi:hypothetical protein
MTLAPLNSEPIDSWRSGTGRVIQVGDLVYRGTSASKLYRVKSMRQHPDRVEVTVVHANGNRKGTWRTFLVEDLHQKRTAVEVR